MRCVQLRRCSTNLVRWTEVQAGDLSGLSVVGASPGLAWAHGLGSSCQADTARGIDGILNPRTLGRSVLRVDLRGHGRSGSTHEADRGSSQYTWPELARDLRRASHATLSRAFFGGEALGAAVALHAAVAAIASGAPDSPPGLVLARPPLALARMTVTDSCGIQQRQQQQQGDRLEAAAAAVGQGWEVLEQMETDTGETFLDGVDIMYGGGPHDCANEALLKERRAIPTEVYAAALRGYKQSLDPPGGKFLQTICHQRKEAMADDAYGVPLTKQCQVLLLAVPGDSNHPVEAAEQLAETLPGSECIVAKSIQEARENWPRQIAAFLKRAWMKEFLAKRTMPQ